MKDSHSLRPPRPLQESSVARGIKRPPLYVSRRRMQRLRTAALRKRLGRSVRSLSREMLFPRMSLVQGLEI